MQRLDTQEGYSPLRAGFCTTACHAVGRAPHLRLLSFSRCLAFMPAQKLSAKCVRLLALARLLSLSGLAPTSTRVCNAVHVGRALSMVFVQS